MSPPEHTCADQKWSCTRGPCHRSPGYFVLFNTARLSDCKTISVMSIALDTYNSYIIYHYQTVLDSFGRFGVKQPNSSPMTENTLIRWARPCRRWCCNEELRPLNNVAHQTISRAEGEGGCKDVLPLIASMSAKNFCLISTGTARHMSSPSPASLQQVSVGISSTCGTSGASAWNFTPPNSAFPFPFFQSSRREFLTTFTESRTEVWSRETEKMGTPSSMAACSSAPSYRVLWKMTVFLLPCRALNWDTCHVAQLLVPCLCLQHSRPPAILVAQTDHQATELSPENLWNSSAHHWIASLHSGRDTDPLGWPLGALAKKIANARQARRRTCNNHKSNFKNTSVFFSKPDFKTHLFRNSFFKTHFSKLIFPFIDLHSVKAE